MKEQSGPDARENARTPETADDSGVQYLKSLCDRRDAAVANPFTSDEDLPEPVDSGAPTAKS